MTSTKYLVLTVYISAKIIFGRSLQTGTIKVTDDIAIELRYSVKLLWGES